MKKHLFSLLFAVVASIVSLLASDISVDGIWYDIDATNLTATITYQGSSSLSYTNEYSGNVVIPSSFNYENSTYSVTSIGDGAFRGCSGLTSVTIPNSVTSIGEKAFYKCSSLASITIPNSVTSIGDNAFKGCSSLPVIDNLRYADTYLVEAVDKTLSNYTLQDGTRWIGNYAFSGCSGLTSVTIPNSVTSIGEMAFEGCSSLTSVTIPNSVTSIGEMAFEGCSSLTSITIPDSITSIGNYAFYNCSGLTSITIPENVTTIGNRAFAGCSGLTSITIPNSVTSIGHYAFYCCSGLTSITIPNSVTSIGEDAFENCSGLTQVNISDLSAWCKINFSYDSYSNPLYYAHHLYLNGEEITDLVIPNDVTRIASDAFKGCSELTSVTIGNSVTSIGGSAFAYCSSLNNVYCLPQTPPSISSSTFKNISSNAIVHVTFGYAGLYKSADYWKNMTIQTTINYSTYSTPTSEILEFVPDNYIASVGIEGGEQEAGNVLEYIGLEPNSEYTDVPIVLTANTGETETVNVSFTTTALELTTKQPKIVSSTTAILLAETNMSEAETSCGFEYKRNDAPADMAGTKVYAPVANGTMAGRLKNLKDDVYYKYRAFYESAAGNMYYGDWQYIFTGDNAIEFDPILYTYAATAVSETQATLKGYALAGTDDFTEQGFEYWADSRTANAASAPRRMPAALGEHHFVQANVISMRVTLTDLDAGTVYKYRTYAKMGEQVIYGTEMSFTTTGEYKAPTYTIRFVDYDNTELLVLSDVEEGTVPAYTGEEPTREEDEQYTYTFSGWAPTIVAATEDATYTATYTAEEKQTSNIEDVLNAPNSDHVRKIIIEGNLYIIKNGKSYNALGAEVK